MGRGSTSNKLDRLDQILGKLKSGDACTATNLADDLDISVRTLMRDLETLRAKGYPIESEKGRGGGIRLYPRWGIGRIALNYREVIDLLLALSILEKMHSPLFLNNLKSVRNKLFASFPDSQKPAIKQIRRRVLVGSPASEKILENYNSIKKNKLTDSVLESFFETTVIEISYQRADGELSKRKIEAQYLFLNWPVWYVIAWDRLRNSARTFRLDRIKKASKDEEVFALRPLKDFSEELMQFANPL